MELDDVAVAVRPRRGLESVDLGFRLARANAFALWGAFAPVVIGVAVLVCVALRDEPWLACLAVWWLKPWYDRIALHVLSRAVFGATPRVRDTLRALPRMFRRGALAGVLHMRFDVARSLNLAPWQLEEQSWSGWRRRVRLIETPVRSTAGWLTVTCIAFEMAGVAAMLALVFWLIPPPLLEALDRWLWDQAELEAMFNWVLIGTWVVAIVLIEPLYVAGGFALYLNRRTQLEAWDLEIAFRRMARRHLARATGSPA